MREDTGTVDLGVTQDAELLLVRQFTPHLRGDAGDHRSGWDDRAAENERSPGDERSSADHGAGEDHGSHTYEASVFDRAAVDHGVVSDRDVLADDHRAAGIHMDRNVVLQIRAGANRDRGAVAAQHRVVPDAGLGPESNITDHARTGGEKRGLVDFGTQPGDGKNGCGI